MVQTGQSVFFSLLEIFIFSQAGQLDAFNSDGVLVLMAKRAAKHEAGRPFAEDFIVVIAETITDDFGFVHD